MEIAVYDNRNGVGYRFHEETEKVSANHEKEIKGIAPNEGEGESNVNLYKPAPICTRFSETKDGNEWILSHIFHNVSREGERKHHAIVSYILNEDEADRLFEYSYEEFSKLERLSQGLIDRPNQRDLNDVTDDFFSKLTKRVSNAEQNKSQKETERFSLYYSALCDKKKEQMYMVDAPAERDMTWFFGSLPPLLRKRVSFCVNAEDVNETADVSLIFCTNASRKKMEKQGGGPQVKKNDFRTLKSADFNIDESALRDAAVYADILAVDDWDTYFRYAGALATRDSNEIERTIGRKNINDILESGDGREAVKFLAMMFGKRGGQNSVKRKNDDDSSQDPKRHDTGDDSSQDPKRHDTGGKKKPESKKGVSFSLSSLPVWARRMIYGGIAALLALCLFKLFPLGMSSENVVYYISVGAAPSGLMTNARSATTAQSPGNPRTETESDAANGNASQEQSADSGQSDAASDAQDPSANEEGAVAAPIRRVQIDENSVSVWIDGVPVGASVHTLQIDGSVSAWLKGVLMASAFWGLIIFIRKFLTCS